MMSADTRTRKRKSGDDVVPAAKKVKTATTAKKSTPLKSALKKSKVETALEEPKGKKTTASSKTPPDTTSKKIKASSKAAKEKATVAAPEESEDEDDEEGGAELTADRTAELLAGFSDSEDDDEAAAGEEGIDISKLPVAPVPKDTTTKTSSNDPERTPGVVYISRIPHGFYEAQMRAYFSQFGTITHLRLARNPRTGKSRHHAFVEFESASVAEIVAKTMDKYLLFGHLLQVRRVPQEQVKENMWDTKRKRQRGKRGGRNRMEAGKLRRGVGREQWEGRVEREEKRRKDKAETLKEMGYEFEMPAVKSVQDVPVKAVEDADVSAEVEAAEEGGVKLLEGKKVEVAPGVEEKVEKVVDAATGETTIVAEKIVKRKNKTSRATTTTKKRNVKATA